MEEEEQVMHLKERLVTKGTFGWPERNEVHKGPVLFTCITVPSRWPCKRRHSARTDGRLAGRLDGWRKRWVRDMRPVLPTAAS